MNNNEYQSLALRTESSPEDAVERLNTNIELTNKLYHACKEAVKISEVLDGYKRIVYYDSQPKSSIDLESYDENTNTNYISADDNDIRILHGALGLITEAGEFMLSLINKIEGKEFDKVNALEELGDIKWYMALLCDALDGDMGDIMSKNINKLQVRYPDKFTTDKAENRNLTEERNTLE